LVARRFAAFAIGARIEAYVPRLAASHAGKRDSSIDFQGAKSPSLQGLRSRRLREDFLLMWTDMESPSGPSFMLATRGVT
jgi:hypothetical protein